MRALDATHGRDIHRGRIRILAAVAALLVPLGTTGCQDVRSNPPNIAMIVLDTARADRLSLYGYPKPTSPFLERFGAESTRFDRAYSSSSWTLPSHGSLFTGVSPKIHKGNQTFSKVSGALPLLAEQLADAGYQTAGFSGNIWITDHGGLARGFEHFEDLNRGIYAEHTKRLAQDFSGAAPPAEDHYVVKQVRTWLNNERDSERPLFLFVNLVEPHLPYLPSWEAARHFIPTRGIRWKTIQRFYPDSVARLVIYRHYGRAQPLTEVEWDALARMYEGSLRMTDDLSRALVAAIDAAIDRADDENESYVFILSDHGENLGDHGHFTHIFNLYDSNIRIVLVARGPGFEAGAVEERLVHITDIHATVLAAAGLDLPENAQGIDLRGTIPSDRVVASSLEYPRISLDIFPASASQKTLEPYKVELAAAVGPRFKLIRSTTQDGDVVREEIYDLLQDPDETETLDSDDVDPDALDRLRSALGDAAGSSERAAEEASMDDDVLESLRALGYVRDEEPTTAAPPGTEPNRAEH
ncbi:MAG: sulfatase [bacterium]|nr:sulfatase [bacterium]